MYSITLISTMHSERGKCNADELLKIIESIAPDVIFEELPPDLFNILYKTNKFLDSEPPEVKAVKRYLLNHNINNFPVDIPFNIELSNEIDFMFNTFKKYNVYKEIEDEESKLIKIYGFDFLNSKKCEDLCEKKRIKEIELMENIMHKDILLRIHKSFCEEQDKREYAWIQNIYNYSTENQFSQALLLTGSGHRKSLGQKIEKDNLGLNWTFYNSGKEIEI